MSYFLNIQAELTTLCLNCYYLAGLVEFRVTLTFDVDINSSAGSASSEINLVDRVSVIHVVSEGSAGDEILSEGLHFLTL